MAASVTATEFAKNFGRYQDQALSGEPVRVTSHGRVVGGFISEADLRHFEQLKRRERQALVVGQLPEDVVAGIAAAEYGADPA
ncbi:MAG: type II toxin-antitoxin system Phd/YefM family antitoxin [Rhodospirillaceae bacterium]|nr:type II toxin-antitoxin system Phd/YefM family antitoxin [Rhodospirillaceae bacterium]